MSKADASEQLFREIRKEVRDRAVLDAIRSIPRELFVPPEYQQSAWENRPLPIGAGQTISQPLIVAVMTEALALKPSDRVLELGTGSGYQTAILARLAAEVVSVERYPELQAAAAGALATLGIHNVRLEPALPDVLGFMEAAPYDAIIATAAAPDVPPVLLAQLAPGGRLVIPVGTLVNQELLLVTRETGGYKQRSLGACRFVPLVGPGAWPEGTAMGPHRPAPLPSERERGRTDQAWLDSTPLARPGGRGAGSDRSDGRAFLTFPPP